MARVSSRSSTLAIPPYEGCIDITFRALQLMSRAFDVCQAEPFDAACEFNDSADYV